MAGLDFSKQATPIQGQGGSEIDIGPVPLDQAMDKSSGAPYFIRQAVGGARSQDDKLKTLRQWYPDAQSYGEDNFVFTDPKTKRPTLYNPKGLDFGDLGSVMPEIYEFGGGVIGGAAAVPAAIGGAPATGGASLAAIPAGVGLGAAGGRELEDIITKATIGRGDTRGLLRRLVGDPAMTAGVNAVGQRAGELVGQGVTRLVGPATRRIFTKSTPPEIATTFERQDVTPTPGAVSGSRPVQIAEKALSYTPGGSAVMQDVSERAVQQTGEAVNRLAGVGNRMTPQATGGVLREGAQQAGDRFAHRREVLDQGIEMAIGRDTMVDIAGAQGLLSELETQLSVAPRTLNPSLREAITELQGLTADAKKYGDTIPFWVLRRLRSRVGALLEAPDITGYSPAAKAVMRRLYGTLAEDVKAAARSAGPAAERALKLHDRYVRFNRNVNIPVLDDMLRKGTDEKMFEWAIGQGKSGGTRLAQLRRQMRDQLGREGDVWDEVVSTVLTRMGQATPGKQGMPTELLGAGDTFSPQTFLTNFTKLSPEAKSALFGGTRYAELREGLQDVVKITASLRDVESMANPSGTARNILFASLGFAVIEASSGNIGRAGSIVAGAVAAPYVAAKLLTNPRFVRWLGSSRMIGNSPNSIKNHLARLALIAKAEPEIQDEINQYEAAVRSRFAIATPANAPGASRATGGPLSIEQMPR